MRLKLDQFDQDTVEMIPDIIGMQSPTELTQYFIKTWSLTYTEQSTDFNMLIFFHKSTLL